MSNNNQDFARKFSDLFHEEPAENTPIYAELQDIESRYRFVETVATGGMKKITKVFDQSTSRHVAMAELLPDIDTSFNELFLKEARLTAMLEHPNIISIHDIGVNEKGLPFFTMDLKEGNSLQDILRRLSQSDKHYENTYPLHELLLIFIKICDAISFAHSRGIIHLDLKPANIQVGRFGEVLVCDWGLGKTLNQHETQDFEELLLNTDLLNHVTQRNEIIGTPGYMAPEQTETKSLLDEKADVFALGCMLYSILCLKPPFSGSTFEDILKKTRQGDFLEPSNNLGRPLPQSLLAVIKRCMKVNKDERYNSVAQVKLDIQKYLSGFSTEAEEASLLKELRLLIKRNKAASVTSFSALLIIFALCFYFINALQEQVKVAQIETLRAEESAHNLEQEKNKSDQLLQESKELVNRLMNSFLSESELTSKTFIYEYPRQSLNKTLTNAKELLKIDPKNIAARHHLILSLFLMQRFKEINELPYKESKTLRDLSKKYVDATRAPIGLLKIESLAKLIADLRNNIRYDYPVALRLLAYDSSVRGNPNYYDQVVIELLKMINPKWDAKGFNYSYREQSLIINSQGIEFLKSPEYYASGKNPLSFLNLSTLKISKTSIQDITEVEGLKISTLDISNSGISQLDKIYKVKSLKKLIIHRGQLPSKQINKLKTSIYIEVL
ncbi:probable serine/threonine-protein kinase pknB [Lentisphaera araneosa HTCC2155]|uniref:Probable serine/threonine-protein kinase pknB n=1 Tax=Lentisphaera araneosa HTCC2155 TaxID=313628 RepID=A6DGX6_9BACT|nr:serine/threonine-protein kinase [Lentisphaera araneosa]EDM28859.1 probable serine/threonine-protein kinase pknB [Lentisphaera araneosa HTCC2155]